MRKIFLSILLLASFSSGRAFADEGPNEPVFEEDRYQCWAQDHDSFWYVGYPFFDFAEAQKSALKSCRAGSVLPWSCRVLECKNLSFVNSTK